MLFAARPFGVSNKLGQYTANLRIKHKSQKKLWVKYIKCNRVSDIIRIGK